VALRLVRERVTKPSRDRGDHQFTALQGQYLAFIHTYSLIHRRAPAQADIQQFFLVTPPSVHQMVLTLEKRGLLARTPGVARSLRVLVSPDKLPVLVDPTARDEA
jgi:DNA-binding MarR family transcriptional regulator